MKTPGVLLQHIDGRKGIAYNKEQKLGMDGYLVRVIDNKYKRTGAKVIWKSEKVKLVGYVD